MPEVRDIAQASLVRRAHASGVRVAQRKVAGTCRRRRCASAAGETGGRQQSDKHDHYPQTAEHGLSPLNPVSKGRGYTTATQRPSACDALAASITSWTFNAS